MLELEDFDRFFKEGTGYEPYPWQRHYARKLCTEGWKAKGWERLSKPTAAGKTEGLLYAWLFALAYQLERGDRKVPLRLFWTIDRRIVVDTVYRLGERLRASLLSAKRRSVCSQVRTALGRMGTEEPFRVVRMRGGIPVPSEWLHDPRQPTFISTTVDQVGSSLLFRKYGAGFKTWSSYAGLAANDSAVVLDEAHLSQSFVETVETIQRHHPGRFFLVQVSATLRGAKDAGSLSEDDLQHPILGPRMRCSKSPRLVGCSGEGALAKSLAREAKKEAKGRDPSPVVAIVCNRVWTARQVFELLRGDQDARLFIGRSRQFDRDRITEEVLPFIESRSDRRPPDRPLYVVATQCVEVGADFDFDILVTECAPLNCLFQRAGRLGRLGDRAVSLVIVQSPGKDPVYEGRSLETWEWLRQQEGLDFSWEGQMRLMAQHGAEALEKLYSPPQETPRFTWHVAKTLSRTSPVAANTPTLERFLHGYNRSPDVTLLWRADLPEDSAFEKLAASTVALCPPLPGEGVEIPIWMARAFLEGDHPHGMADVATEPPKRKKGHVQCFPVLRWRGDDSDVVTNPAAIRPGDVLVLPVSRGGCDEFGWTGGPQTEPEDLADKILHATGKSRLRLHPSLISGKAEAFAELRRRVDDGETLDVSFVRALFDGHPLAEHVQKSGARLRREVYPDGKGVFVYDPRHLPVSYDDGATAPREVPLEEHLQNVSRWARVYAEPLFGEEVAADFALTGLLHDLGKADPRWQQFIYGGKYKPGAPVIAKASTRLDWRPFNWPMPKNLRHEFASLRLVEEGVLLEGAHDPELVAFLLGTHHGYGCPFAPAFHDENPVIFSSTCPDGKSVMVSSDYAYARIDSGWADRYAAVVERYGLWIVAYFRAVFHAADVRASIEERGGDDV